MAQKRTEKIQFHYLVPPFGFSGRNELKQLLLAVFKAEGVVAGHLNYIFCSDEYLLEINRTHLRHDTYTDIITFQYSAPDQPVVSDVYISIERVKENALVYQASFQKELSRVIIHGALHLCGYKDKSTAQRKQMREMEDHYLSKLFHVEQKK